MPVAEKGLRNKGRRKEGPGKRHKGLETLRTRRKTVRGERMEKPEAPEEGTGRHRERPTGAGRSTDKDREAAALVL